MLIKGKRVSLRWMITAEISAFWQEFPVRQKALSFRNSEQNSLWILFVGIIHCVWTFCQLRDCLTESLQECLLPLTSSDALFASRGVALTYEEPPSIFWQIWVVSHMYSLAYLQSDFFHNQWGHLLSDNPEIRFNSLRCTRKLYL